MDNFTFSFSYRNYNEDRVYVTDNFGFILDGASNLTKQERIISDSSWFVDEWKSYLINNLPNKSVSIKNIVKHGIEVIKERFEEYIKDQHCEEFPSCSACIFRINGPDFEYFILGDSPMLIQSVYGDCFEFVPEDCRRLDNTNKMLLHYKAKNSGISMVDAKRKFNTSLLNARQKRNQAGVFHIIADYPFAVEYALFGSIPTKLIDRVMLMSDGFAQLYYLFNAVSIKKLINTVNNYNDANKYYKKLLKIQNKDFLCEKYPRFKRTDDSSLILYKF